MFSVRTFSHVSLHGFEVLVDVRANEITLSESNKYVLKILSKQNKNGLTNNIL